MILRQRLRFGDVENGARDPPAVERGQESFLIDQATSRGVDDKPKSRSWT
jgi:hypothetical protein